MFRSLLIYLYTLDSSVYQLFSKEEERLCLRVGASQKAQGKLEEN